MLLIDILAETNLLPVMNFHDLHESVRAELQRRVNAGLITATSLAHQAGFRQAHISNFLNRRRSLSLEGLDRVMAAQNLSVVDLVAHGAAPPGESGLDMSASAEGDATTSTRDSSEPIPVVSHWTAMEEPVVRTGSVIETVYFATSRLAASRARPAAGRTHWQRFVAIRADAHQAAGMDPIVPVDSVVVLDRHYNSLAPYRPQERTLYAVRSGSGLMLRFLEFDDTRLILRPISLDFPVQLIALADNESPSDYIVGRVSLVLREL